MKPTSRSHRLTHRLDKLRSLVASRRRLSSNGARTRPRLAYGLVILAIAIAILGSGPAVGAQETGESEPVEVTVTEEPGVCTELGAVLRAPHGLDGQ